LNVKTVTESFNKVEIVMSYKADDWKIPKTKKSVTGPQQASNP